MEVLLTKDIRLIIDKYLFDYRYTVLKNQYVSQRVEKDDPYHFYLYIGSKLYNWRPLSNIVFDNYHLIHQSFNPNCAGAHRRPKPQNLPVNYTYTKRIIKSHNMEVLLSKDIRFIIHKYLFDYRYTELKKQYFQFIHCMLKADADDGLYHGPHSAKKLFNWRPLSYSGDDHIFRLVDGCRRRTVHKLPVNYI